MRLRRLFIGILLSCAATVAYGQQGPRLTVMTYNIHHGAGADGQLNVQAMADVIRQNDVDVVGLQEVDRHWSQRSEFADQVEELANRLGMNAFFAPIYDRLPPRKGRPRRQYGPAVLTRFPIVTQTNHDVTRLSTLDEQQKPQRKGGFPEITVEVMSTRVHVFATHLDYRKDPAVRRQQVADMRKILTNRSSPTVLVGDFNATPESDALRPLWNTFVDAWAERGRGPGHTYPSDDPTKRIDYVAVTPSISVDSVAVLDIQASDHRPVKAVLTLPAGSETGMQ